MRALVFNGPGNPRLTDFIRMQFPHLGPGALHKYLRQNKIKLNGKKQPLTTRLAAGDEICLYLPDTELAAQPLCVLFEDEHLLAVHKQPGIATAGEDGGATLATRVAEYASTHAFAQPALPCHRLDTGTSGVVLFAKTPQMLDCVLALLHAHALTKTYVCVTVGHPAPAAATLRGWLQKNSRQGVVRIQHTQGRGAKQIVTQYKTLATSGPLALLRVTLVTGRTHQIRAHMASIGTPVLGDGKYGNLAANRQRRCRYQCLHAESIQFPKQMPPGFEKYAGLKIADEPPWFYKQVISGELQ